MRRTARRIRRRTFNMAGYLAALCLLLISAGCSAMRTPDGAAAASHDSLHDAYTAARYAVRPVADPQHGVAWEARNAAHALHATFTAAGLDLAVHLPAQGVDVRSTWRLASLGYGAAQQAATPDTCSTRRSGSSVSPAPGRPLQVGAAVRAAERARVW